MGIWDWINSTTEAVKRNAPDPIAAKDACKTSCGYCSAAVGNACKTSYGYGSAAVGKIDNAIRVNGIPRLGGYCSAAFGQIDNTVRVNGIQKVSGYMPDEETRSQISLFASKFAKNAALKMIPGGKAVAEVISETMNDVKSENLRKQEMQAMKEIIGDRKTLTSSRELLDRVDMQSRGVEMGYDKGHLGGLTANQTPEDVLRIFMMKEFMGTRFADDLILSQIKHGIKSK